MSNSYTPTEWIPNRTIGTADVFNNMEEGILNAHQKVDELDLQVKEKVNKKDDKTKLEIYSINLQSTGDCILVKTNNGTNILCDTGIEDDYDSVDNFLSSNIDKLNYIIITHYHDDHVGNLSRILNKYKSDDCVVILPCEPDFSKMISNGNRFKNKTQEVYDICDNKGVTKKIPTEGEILNIDDIELKFMNCSPSMFGNYYDKKSEYTSVEETDYNNFSLVFEITHKNNTILFTGDINITAQENLSTYLKKCDLLKCPHHSVDTVMYRIFFEKVFPQMAFSSNNGQSSLRKSQITKTLLSLGVPYYVTCQGGDLKFISDGHKIQCENKTYFTSLTMQKFMTVWDIKNYMYFGFGEIIQEYNTSPKTVTLEDAIKQMAQGSCAVVNFVSGNATTPSFISGAGGNGFLIKTTSNKAIILLTDASVNVKKSYIGVWVNSSGNVVWYQLGNQESINAILNKIDSDYNIKTYNTYSAMSDLGITTSSTALEMITAMPSSSMYSGKVLETFDPILGGRAAIAEIVKSSDGNQAKIRLTTIETGKIEEFVGIYNPDVQNTIIWKKVNLTDI